MWYNRVVENLGEIPGMIDYYDRQLSQAQAEVKIKGSLETSIAQLPGIVEFRYSELQEVEAILEFLNIQLRKLRRKYFQKYMESYNKALTAREAEKYTDGEQEVCDFEMIINSVALVRNRYLSIHKGLEAKGFMLGHVTRLRTAGLENVTIAEK